MQNAFKYAIALLASLLLTGSLLAVSTGPAQAAEPAVKIIQHNLDGGSASFALAKANDQNAKIMALQELCRTELDSLQAGNWKSSGSWIVTKPDGCGAGNDKGQAILYRGVVTVAANATQTELFNPGDPDGLGPALGGTGRSAFALTCFSNMKGLISKQLSVCTTHLFTNSDGAYDGDAIRETHMNKIEDTLLPWADLARKVIFTGDLNMQPGTASLNQVYNNFTEASGVRNGSEAYWTTATRKIDYVFGDSSPALVNSSLPTNASVYSGHHVLKASITFP